MLRLQSDGNLVVYSAAGRPLWHSATHGTGATRLLLQGDGNAVLYDNGNTPFWASAGIR